MSKTLDVVYVLRDINHFLGTLGFTPGDADGTDFRRGQDRGLRFKTGSSRGEVAITVWSDGKQTGVVRILNEDQVPQVKRKIKHLTDLRADLLEAEAAE